MLGALVLSGGSWLVDSLFLRSSVAAPPSDDALIDSDSPASPARKAAATAGTKAEDEAVALRTAVASRLAFASGPGGATGATGATGPTGFDAFDMPASWRPVAKAKAMVVEAAPAPKVDDVIGQPPRVSGTVILGSLRSARLVLPSGGTPSLKVGESLGDWRLVDVSALGAIFEHVPTGKKINEPIKRESEPKGG